MHRATETCWWTRKGAETRAIASPLSTHFDCIDTPQTRGVQIVTARSATTTKR